MFKSIKDIFIERTPEQTYLAERLQSAKGLGWEMPSSPEATLSLLGVADRSSVQAKTADQSGEDVSVVGIASVKPA